MSLRPARVWRAPIVAMLFCLMLSACGAASETSGDALKLYIGATGFYHLSRAELPAALRATDARVRLTHRGAEVAFEQDDDGLTFYAAPENSPYSPSDVYWLTRDERADPRVGTRTVAAPAGQTATTMTSTLSLAEKRIYFPTAIGGTRWFWEALTAPAEKTYRADLPSLVAGEVQLELRLAGATSAQHRVQVRVNQQSIGEAAWNGQAAHIFRARVSNLRARDNDITLLAPASSDKAEVVFLEAITFAYTRALAASDNYLAFAGAQSFHVRAFNSDAIALYDVSEPHAVTRLSGARIDRAQDGYTLSFHDEQPSRRYVALTRAAWQKPLAVRAAAPNTLRARDQHADYLIIAPAEFHAALAPLVQQRTANGLATLLVDIEQVYDAFSDGVPDPRALRDFLRFASTQWSGPAPRYALLVGKASYDYRDYLKAPNKNLVPTFLLPTPHLGEAASDDWFAQASESGFQPSLAVGRIPAKTSAQVSVAVQKIIAYEAQRDAEWMRRAVFVTDNLEPSFDARAERYLHALSPESRAQKIYLSQYAALDAVRGEIIRQWNAGASLLTYIGHGSINLWAQGPLFSTSDVAALNNGERLPVLLTPTCLDGFFYHPQLDSLTEALLFRSEGGIIAGIVPTGFSLQEPQDVLMTALFAELYARPAPTLGEALRNAKLRVATRLGDGGEMIEASDLREVLDTFVLLGDPALRWQAP